MYACVLGACVCVCVVCIVCGIAAPNDVGLGLNSPFLLNVGRTDELAHGVVH